MTLFYSKVKDRKPLCKILVWGGIFQFGFNPPPSFSSAMWYWYYWVCSDLEPISEINVKHWQWKKMYLKLPFDFDLMHTIHYLVFGKQFWFSNFIYRYLFACNILYNYLISNFNTCKFYVKWLLPFHLEQPTLILHDSMVFFGSLTFLFFFIFRDSNACLSLDDYTYMYIHCK